MHQNAGLVGPEFCSEPFHIPMNVVPCRNEHYATLRLYRADGLADECRALSERTLRYPSAYTGGRVSVRPSRVNQNSRSVGPEFYSESFPSPMNVVPCRNEHYATPPTMPGGRVSVRPSRVNQNSRSVVPELCS
ncbi:hypothetical protein TNCT_703811 [Trichonephila clavata]|uniref:Uncharacterized protein n=1 Tax=Trichonephila clavata TaxID=2740835 RepID=A0A8X6LD24_TRICU|nr:hypothetical protein TNCT_703811 [Trichonephila clavata]